MKKFLPFVFPALALLIVMFLAYRWFDLKDNTMDKKDVLSEGVQIEELSQEEQNSFLQGMDDYKSKDLKPLADTEGMGTIRYDIKDNVIKFNVQAELPELTSGIYQVWLKSPDSGVLRKAFVLESTKGGFAGSAAISAETLPFEVVVSKEMMDDGVMETMLLEGMLSTE